MSTLEDWTYAIDQGLVDFDVVYLDFSKAFDLVTNQRLFQKLASYGFGGRSLSWLKGFLSDCYQKVVLNESSSSWCPVMSGVPQGLVLGPLLFTLYINDKTNIDLSFFADDSEVYTVIRSLEDSFQLQADFDNIQNLLTCKVMHVGTPTTSEYTLYDTSVRQHVLLAKADCEKDLGVWISGDV